MRLRNNRGHTHVHIFAILTTITVFLCGGWCLCHKQETAEMAKNAIIQVQQVFKKEVKTVEKQFKEKNHERQSIR